MQIRWLWILTLLLATSSVGLVACQPTPMPPTPVPIDAMAIGTNIPFETVVSGILATPERRPEPPENPALLVATTPDEAGSITDKFLMEPNFGGPIVSITDVDYAEYFVVVAYLGFRPHTGVKFAIERITQTNGEVRVVTTVQEASAGGATAIHPVHAVKIRKEALPIKGHLRFEMWANGQVLASHEHIVE